MALKEVDDRWNPKIEKTKADAVKAGDSRLILVEKLKCLRKSLVASDNPDRKELIDILIKD